MAYPRQKEVEIPLLIELDRVGGEAQPRDIYDKVAQHFPSLTEEDLERRLDNYPAVYKWRNLVQWVRQKLVSRGEIDGSVHGVWRITDIGRQHIREKWQITPPSTLELTLGDLLEAHEGAVRNRLSDRLNNLTATEFEFFAKDLLQALGFTEVKVTKTSHDGGIDGHGKLRQGIVKIDAAFQCKRWQGTVPRSEIDRFRGTISGRFDQGIFLTTSGFSQEASDASIRPGAVPIIMIDGSRIVELMIQHGIAVSRRPLYLLDVDEEFFRERE